MIPLNRILVSSSDVVVEPSQTIKAKDGALAALKQNQVVDARVTHVFSSRRVQLMIFGQKVVAGSHLPFKAGDQIQLRVTAAGQQPVFKLLDAGQTSTFSGPAAFLKRLGRSGPYDDLLKFLSARDGEADIPGGKDVKSLGRPAGIERFREIAAGIALKSETADPALLKNIIRGSGLLWEQKLTAALQPGGDVSPESLRRLVEGDLKAVALELMTVKNERSDETLRHLRSFVDTLDQLQLLNRFALDESGKVLLPLPLIWDNLLKFGQLLIDLGEKRSGKEADDERMIRVSMLLEMSNLGDIRADFSMLKRCIGGTFCVGSDALKKFVGDHIPELVERLRRMEFSVQKIDCRVLRPETLAGTSLADQMMPSAEGTLSLMV